MRLLLSTVILSTTSAASIPKHTDSTSQLQHANHIFNAIHSSMRQFGSSLNHNGMSLFVATVPEETELYHGTSNLIRVNGTEWLAFEPEHALIFANHGPPGGGRGRGPPPGQGSPPGDLDGSPGPPSPSPFGADERKSDLRRHEEPAEHPLGTIAENKPALSDDAEERNGYLHTYRTKHALRLLYVDGQSAAKSDKGTLDVQDMVLLHHNPPEGAFAQPPRGPREGFDRVEHRKSLQKQKDKPRRPHGPPGEAERAERMCQLARTEWQDRIDGILRTEGGFEIILCEFEKHLDVVRIAQTNKDARGGPGGPGGPGHDNGDGFNYYGAVAARYDGIGGDRVMLNYDNFVSLLAFEDAVHIDDSGRPRVNNKTSTIEPVREAIKEMISTADNNPAGKDWQSIADMVVARYADRIAYLSSASSFSDLSSFKAEVDRALRPFIDYGDRNTTTEIQRCSAQFLPSAPSSADSIAHRSILDVTNVLCRTLLKASNIDTLSHGLSTVRNLKSWLSWTTWKRCNGCGMHEICFLPIWPMGNEMDFEQPQCRSDIPAAPGGYWGHPGGPGGPPPPPEH